MKQYLLLLGAVLASASGHAQVPAQGQRPSDLRSVVQQRPASAPRSAPRQLSAEERAELRRQLRQQNGRPGRTS